MSIFNKISMEYIKKSKARTITTILGVILSAAIICGVMIFISSFRYYEYINYNEYIINYEPETLEYFTGSFYEFNICFVADFWEIFIPTAIITAIVILVSGVMIYNSFSISIWERTKQAGLISAAGATNKQLRKMVLFEAMIVSAAGIPIGILMGIGGMAVILKLTGHVFTNFLAALPLELYVEPLGIITACVIIFLVVIVASLIASWKAGNISITEAVRKSGYSIDNGKKIKKSKFMCKTFGISGMLADRYYKCNRKRSGNVVAGLCMSIILIVSVSSVGEYLVDSTVRYNPYDFEIRWFSYLEEYDQKSPEEVLDRLLTANGVTDGAFFRFSREKTFINGELKDIKIMFIDDESFKQVLNSHKLSSNEYLNPDAPLALAVDGFLHTDPETYEESAVKLLASDSGELQGIRVPQIEGYSYNDIYVDEDGRTMCWYVAESADAQDIRVPLEEAESTEYTIKYKEVLYVSEGGIPWCTEVTQNTHYDGVFLLYPYSFMDIVLPQGLITGAYIIYMFQSDAHAESTAHIERLIDDMEMTGLVSDEEISAEKSNNQIAAIKLFIYSFTILIFLLSFVNMFNIIYGNIRMRKREYAILKSIGMSVKSFSKMIRLECITYGMKALIYGVPFSLAISYIIGAGMLYWYDQSLYLKFPWKALIIAVLSVFIVVLAAMVYSVNRVKKDEIIDILKNNI